MSTKWVPKVGDRVRLFDRSSVFDGRIEAAVNDFTFKVRVGSGGKGFETFAHRKQLRRLMKRARREWWVYEGDGSRLAWRESFEMENGTFIRTTRPNDVTGWIRVMEVKA